METQKLANQSNWKQIIKKKESKLEFFSQGTIKKPYQVGDTWEIPLSLKKLKTKWAKVLRQVYQHPMSFPGSLSPAMGELVRALIMNIAPKNVMEIGSYIGVSCLWIASGMAEYDGHHKLYCVDLFNPHRDNPWCPGVEMPDPKGFIKKNIKKCGFQNFIEVYTGDSKTIAPQIAEELKEPFDFVFIDGDHSVEGCENDFWAIEPYVASGGYIMLHDIFPDHCGADGPAYMLHKLLVSSEKKYELCQIYTSPLNFGLAIIRKSN